MNIELHGFDLPHVPGWKSSKLREQIQNALLKYVQPGIVKNTVVTIIPSDTHNYNDEDAPFIRIYSDRQDHFSIAKSILKRIQSLKRRSLPVPVECMELKDYFEI